MHKALEEDEHIQANRCVLLCYVIPATVLMSTASVVMFTLLHAQAARGGRAHTPQRANKCVADGQLYNRCWLLAGLWQCCSAVCCCQQLSVGYVERNCREPVAVLSCRRLLCSCWLFGGLEVWMCC
jgi:hypothetical protein